MARAGRREAILSVVRAKPIEQAIERARSSYEFVEQPPLPRSRKLRRNQLLRQGLRHVTVDVNSAA